MDCAEACVVLIIESLQQPQDCIKGNNSRFISSLSRRLLRTQSPYSALDAVVHEVKKRQLIAMIKDLEVTRASYSVGLYRYEWERGQGELPPNAKILSLGPGCIFAKNPRPDINKILHFGGVSEEVKSWTNRKRISARYEMLTVQQLTSKSNHENQNHTPDFMSLRLSDQLNCSQAHRVAFDLPRTKNGLLLQGAVRRILASKEDLVIKGIDSEDWNIEDELDAGQLILCGTFKVSAEHGRPKPMGVYLFRHTLLILRTNSPENDSVSKVVYKIPLQRDIIATTFHSAENLLRGIPGSGALMIYWFGNNEEEISGAKIFFHDMETLQIWAGYLALHNGGGGDLTERTSQDAEESSAEFIRICNMLDETCNLRSDDSDQNSESSDDDGW